MIQFHFEIDATVGIELMLEGMKANGNRQMTAKMERHAEAYCGSNRTLSAFRETNLTGSTHSYEDHEAMQFVEGVFPPLPAGDRMTKQIEEMRRYR